MRMGGVDNSYIANGGSFFTVESHIQHLAEVMAEELIHVSTQILAVTGKKMHLFHTLLNHSGKKLATGEHMLLHVNMKTRRATLPTDNVALKLSKMAEAHASYEKPSTAGQAISIKPKI